MPTMKNPIMVKRSSSSLLSKHLLGLNPTNPTRKFSQSKINNSSPRTKNANFLISSNSLITRNGRNGNLKDAESVFEKMVSKDVVSWTAMLTAYAENGKIDKARQLFDEMPQRNTASWNAMITGYINNCCVSEAYEVFGKMPSRNPVSYAAMITGFARVGMLRDAEKLYHEMPLIGRDPTASNALISGYLRMGRLKDAIRLFDRMVERDVVSWSSIVDGFCKNGRIEEAREMFGKMPDRNVVSWTSMIGGCLQNGMWEDGFELFLRMRRDGVRINQTTLSVIFDACAGLGKLREGKQIHGLVLLFGFDFDVFLGNSMISMYSKTGLMDAACKIFRLMNKKDLVSWNSLIGGYVQNCRTDEAFELFEEMPRRDVVSWTSMIKGFSDSGRIEKSLELFEEMPVKDNIAWTAIISGFVSSGDYENAIRWFIRMVQEGVEPNSPTFSCILSASAGLAALNQGEQFHAQAVKMGLQFDLSVQNSLVSMYAKCGNLTNAQLIFSRIKDPNVISWNSMITGFAQHGFGELALELFKKMEPDGFKPNEISFLGVLSACVHMGLVEEAWAFFKSMKSSYFIEPGPDHFACMVDLLGRAGLIQEAMDLIDSMPFKPHSAIWGALLSASRTHKDLDLAKVAAKNLFELEPDNGTAYVVLSNMFAIAGMQEEGDELRMLKRTKGVKKSPGCSWIIVDNKINLFYAGDKSHPRFKEIRAVLRKIAKEIVEVDCD